MRDFQQQQRAAESSREQQRAAESSREQQKAAESSREQQRAAESSRKKQKEAESSREQQIRSQKAPKMTPYGPQNAQKMVPKWSPEPPGTPKGAQNSIFYFRGRF